LGEALTCQRAVFSLPDDVHYLNCAYMSPLSRPVEEAGRSGMQRKRMPAEILPGDFFGTSDLLRNRFARLVGAQDPNRIAILPSASYGVAAAAKNCRVAASQNIVLVHEQFPGNVYSWRRLADESEARIRTVHPPGAAPAGAVWTERVLEAIDSDTAVVTLPHAHWTDGTRFDLQAIGARAREVGAALIVDGTQSVGAMPFDVGELRPDALIVAGYKWLMGPYSIGLGYFGPRFDDGSPLEETWIAREGSEDFQHLVDYQDAYQPGAIRYDVGERSNFILVPMQLAALELVLDWTPERIADYCRALSGPLIEAAVSLGFTVEDSDWRADHLFGLRMPPGLELGALKQALEERRIYVSLRGSAMRVSPHLYNDEADVDALIEALRAARA
jgi:selenocysteine lyase/cysteine desulfurase